MNFAKFNAANIICFTSTYSVYFFAAITEYCLSSCFIPNANLTV